jgi:hypothetical protein
MTDTNSPAGTRMPSQSPRYTEPTGWVGWIAFAAVMMVLIGGLHAIQGLVALFKDEYYVVTNSGLVLTVDYTGWGWVHLIFGILVCLTGIVLFTGRTWARVVGVCAAVLSILINFAFIAAYPFWSLTVIAVDIFVIYALIVHGREMREVRTV